MPILATLTNHRAAQIELDKAKKGGKQLPERGVSYCITAAGRIT